LDALLDKISSIVDCSPRNPDDLESLDKNEECDSASTKEKPADETDEKQVEQIELEIEEEEGEGEVSESKENEARVELDSEIETEDKTAVDLCLLLPAYVRFYCPLLSNAYRYLGWHLS